MLKCQTEETAGMDCTQAWKLHPFLPGSRISGARADPYPPIKAFEKAVFYHTFIISQTSGDELKNFYLKKGNRHKNTLSLVPDHLQDAAKLPRLKKRVIFSL